MGKPVEVSPENRAKTRSLAAAIVESVRNDEEMPLPGVVDCYARASSVERDGVESLVMEMAQEIVALAATLDLARKVVDERRAAINHARETTAMCRLAKSIDSATKEHGDE